MKMVLLSVGISGALAAGLTWFGYAKAASGLRSKSELALGSESLLTAMTIDNWMAEGLLTLRGVAGLRSVRTVLETAPSVAPEDLEATNLALADIAAVAPEIESIEVIDLRGGVIASTTDELQPKELLHRPEMRSALDGREYVSGISISPSTGAPCLYSSVPARGSNGIVVGVVRSRQSLGRVQTLVEGAKARMGERAQGVVLDRDGLVVATTVQEAWRLRPVAPLTPQQEKEMLTEGRWGQDSLPAHLNAPDLAANRKESGRTVFSWSIAGIPHVAVAEPIGHAGWTYAAALPVSQVESEARDFLLLALEGAVLGLFAALVLAQIVARRIVKSIHHLIDVSRRVVAENDLTQPIELTSNDEVGILGEAFREMMVKLRERSGQLEEARAQAEAASRAKSSFLAGMSHELRTPLNAILGFGELLEDELPGPLTGRQKEYVGHVLQSGRHLLELINDLLDLAKAEAGRIQLRLERTSIARCVDEVRPGIQALSERARVSVAYDVPLDLPDLSVDPLRLRQVLYNLLSNAVKFTPEGGNIQVRARSAAPWVQVDVADTGIGVPAEALPRLFHEFEQVERDGHRPGGTGLGLALSRRLIEAHGGSISITSKLGVGSTITFTLPAGAQQ